MFNFTSLPSHSSNPITIIISFPRLSVLIVIMYVYGHFKPVLQLTSDQSFVHLAVSSRMVDKIAVGLVVAVVILLGIVFVPLFLYFCVWRKKERGRDFTFCMAFVRVSDL